MITGCAAFGFEANFQKLSKKNIIIKKWGIEFPRGKNFIFEKIIRNNCKTVPQQLKTQFLIINTWKNTKMIHSQENHECWFFFWKCAVTEVPLGEKNIMKSKSCGLIGNFPNCKNIKNNYETGPGPGKTAYFFVRS